MPTASPLILAITLAWSHHMLHRSLITFFPLSPHVPPLLSSQLELISPYLYMNPTLDALSDHIYINQTDPSLSMSMAMMMEVEDDVFFADLNRQISLLITDDNEDGDDVYYSPPISSYPTSISIQGISRTSVFPSTTQSQYYVDHFDQMNYKTSTTTDQSKGTGVFIPNSFQGNRSRRSKHQHQPSRTTHYNNYNSYSSTTNNFRHYHQQQQLPSQAVFSQVIIGSKKC